MTIGDSVREVGPFTFFQKVNYEVLSWSKDENYVVVKQTKSWSFIGNVTAPLDERITVLNVPLIVIYEAIRNTDVYNRRSIKRAAEPILKDLPLFVTRSVNDILFGYKDNTLATLSQIDEIFSRHGEKLVLPDSISSDHHYSVVSSVS